MIIWPVWKFNNHSSTLFCLYLQKQYPPHVGRLIFCGHQRVKGTFCILSDDHGKTWRYGTRGLPAVPFTQKPKTGDLNLNECQVGYNSIGRDTTSSTVYALWYREQIILQYQHLMIFWCMTLWLWNVLNKLLGPYDCCLKQPIFKSIYWPRIHTPSSL